jgi:hypothetical protein
MTNKKLYCKHDKSKTCEEWESAEQQGKCLYKSFSECIGNGQIALCINDPKGKKPCLKEDPNLCQHALYSECLEANGHRNPSPIISNNSHRNSRDSRDEIPSPQTPPPLAQAPAPEKPVYDAYDGKIQEIQNLESSIDTTFENFLKDDLEWATSIIKKCLSENNSSFKNFTKLLIKVKEKFFIEKGKKKGWKEYIEKTIGYNYSHAHNLMQAYSKPILNEYWEKLGTFKLITLNRYKQPITPDLINKILPMTTRETQRNLFPRLTKNKSNIDQLIDKVKSIDPKELKTPVKQRLIKVFEETIKILKKGEKGK